MTQPSKSPGKKRASASSSQSPKKRAAAAAPSAQAKGTTPKKPSGRATPKKATKTTPKKQPKSERKPRPKSPKPDRSRSKSAPRATTPKKRKRDADSGHPGSAKKRRTAEDDVEMTKMEVHAAKIAAKKRAEVQRLRELAKAEGAKEDQPRWPTCHMNFKAWHDEAFDYVRMTLKQRGWKDLGNICDLDKLNADNPEKSIGQEIKDNIALKNGHKLPKRCLWWVHEDDGRRLVDLPEETLKNAKHCITTFIGTNAAVTKVATCQQNDGEAFFPKAFILPKQAEDIKKYIEEKKQNYWIAKPRNDYAGRGVVAYNAKSEEFQKVINDKTRPEFVVQSYLANPLLVGGFKFHFRMYTVLTGVLDDFEAYLYKDGHGLFSTKEYTLDDKTLGDNFDDLVHLTNWSINFIKGNPHLKRNKPVIGVGCEWSVCNVLKMIKKARPEFDVAKFWKDMTEVCAVTMYRIAQWRRVKQKKADNDKHPLRFENFGLDILMDDNFKIWLMEANTEVGLNAIMEDFPDENCVAPSWKKREGDEVYCTKNGCVKCRGGKNLRYKQNNKVLADVIHSSMDLMQLDVPKSRRVNKMLIPLHPVMNHQIMAARGASVAAL